MKSIKEDMTVEEFDEIIKGYGKGGANGAIVSSLLQLHNNGVLVVIQAMSKLGKNKETCTEILKGMDICIKELAMLGLAVISRENIDAIDYLLSKDSQNKTKVEAKKHLKEKGLEV